MPSLAQALSTTCPVSPLLRKARRLGLSTVDSMIALAAKRGCRHYSQEGYRCPDLDTGDISNEELTILLLLGENHYSPDAIRCAAQMAREPSMNAGKLARLAVMEKCERVLSYIAQAGMDHDADGHAFWCQLLSLLPQQEPISSAALPHWSRFVSMPGIQRGGMASPQWLTPQQAS